MKILGLCFVLMFALVQLSLAQASPQPATGDQAEILNPQSSADQPFVLNLEPNRDLVDDSEVFCAYMRTYRVRREYSGSDAVAPAGYTTCVPTRRFELKSAVQVEKKEPVPRQ